MLILIGGPQSVIKIEDYPFLLDEIDCLKKTVEAGKHVIGFCLGTQLMGSAFGATAEKSPHKEIGVFPITFEDTYLQDPIFYDWPKTIPAIHWHGDMPGLPKSATLLAKSQGCPRQIIRFAPRAYGLQCHLEFTLNNIRNLIKAFPEGLSNTTLPYVQEKKDFEQENFNIINELLFILLDRFSSL